MRTLRRLCFVFGAVMAIMGMEQLLAGVRFIPGAKQTDAVADSQIRALGAVAVWAGVAQVWATQRQATQPLRLLGAITASLVAARATGIPRHGRPTGVVLVAIVREAVSAAALLIYSTVLARRENDHAGQPKSRAALKGGQACGYS